MSEKLACPKCKHMQDKPSTRTKRKCRGCGDWIELNKAHTKFQLFAVSQARKAFGKAQWWDEEIAARRHLYGSDEETREAIRREFAERAMAGKVKAGQAIAKSPAVNPKPFTKPAEFLPVSEGAEVPW